MSRALIIASILVLLGGGYALYKKTLTRPPVVAEATKNVQITTATENEEADTYTIDVQYPQFGIPTIDREIKRLVELSISTFKSDVAQGPPPPGSAVTEYEFISRFDSVYVGEDAVSAKLVVSTYMGGAHGMAILNGLNFDRKTGRRLTPEDGFRMIGLTIEEVAAKAKKELQEKLGADIIAPEGADPDAKNYSTFLVSADKVTFVFQAYQVAPYAAGAQEVSFTRVH
ncbi:DUF3298 domain-containing protein [Candidatus Kaiserbacteria bacterium]|nr:DUF3298 domain-containing protein [Candidatus Kaiserbacteria bacterium]